MLICMCETAPARVHMSRITIIDKSSGREETLQSLQCTYGNHHGVSTYPASRDIGNYFDNRQNRESLGQQ